MPPKRFWILEISFITKNVEHSQNERVKCFIKKNWKNELLERNAKKKIEQVYYTAAFTLELWCKCCRNNKPVIKEITDLKKKNSPTYHMEQQSSKPSVPITYALEPYALACMKLLCISRHPLQVPQWNAPRWLPRSTNLLKLPPRSHIMPPHP